MNELQVNDRRIVSQPQRVPAINEPSFLEVIARLAENPNVDVVKMQSLMDMQEHILDRDARQQYNDALSRVQEKIPVVIKNAMGQNSKYASYDKLVAATAPIYTPEGFSVSMYEGVSSRDGWIRVMADIGHRGGHTETRYVDMPADGKGAKGGDVMTLIHAAGSAFSYGKRYLLCLIFNIPTGDDDDGNMASKPNKIISEKQAIEIDKLLTESETDGAKFLAYYDTETIQDIKISQYAEAVKLLKAKIANKKKDRQPGEDDDK